jgi:hypothetical protein
MMGRYLAALGLAVIVGCGPAHQAPASPVSPAGPVCKCETTVPPLGQP